MFASKEDLSDFIATYRIDQIVFDDSTDPDVIVTNALKAAESKVIDALSGPGYDYLTMLAQVGDARNFTLLTWVKDIASYYIYKRIPDEQVPARVVKDYDQAMSDLRLISLGTMSVAFPKVIDSETSRPKTKFKWGSDPRRSRF